MKRLAIALACLSTPALAHPGAHVHPHEGATWITICVALGLLSVGGALAYAHSRTRK